MGVKITSVMTLLFGAVVLSIGQGLHQSLVPIAASEFEFSDFSISFLASVYFLGYLLGCFLAPRLIKRTGHIRSLAFVASFLSGLSLLHILLPNDIVWIVIRLVVGYCFANIDVILESWLADRAESKDRGKILSIYRLLRLLSLGLGQFLLAHASPVEFTLYAIVTILVACAVMVVTATTTKTPPAPKSVNVRFFNMARRVPLSVMSAGFHGLASGIYWGFAPIFASSLTDDRTMVSYILSATLIGAALAQFPVGIASDKYDRRRLIILISLLSVLASLAVALLSFANTEMIFYAMILYGAATFSVYPVAMTYAFDRSEPSEFVEIGATVLIAYGIGACIGPLFTPLALRSGDNSSIFFLIAFFYFCITLFALYRKSRSADVAPEETVEFISVPSSTPVTLEIDPRIESDVFGSQENPKSL